MKFLFCLFAGIALSSFPVTNCELFLLQNLSPSTIYQCIEVQGGSNTGLQLDRCDTSIPDQILQAVGDPNLSSGAFLHLPNGLCINVDSAADDSPANQANCIGTPNQLWTFVYNNTIDDFFQIKNIFSGKCLQSESNGASLEIEDCIDCNLALSLSPKQVWKKVKVQKAEGVLQSVPLATCLHVVGENTSPDAELELHTCTGSPPTPNVKLSTGSNNFIADHIKFTVSNLCMTIQGASVENGPHINQYNCSDGWFQDWQIVNGEFPGPFQLKNPLSGKCATTESTTGTFVYNYDCAATSTDNAYQFFNFLYPSTTPGSVKNFGTGGCITRISILGLLSNSNNAGLISLLGCSPSLALTIDQNIIYGVSSGFIKLPNGKCMTVFNGSNNNGAAIVQYTCSGYNYQNWEIIGGNTNGLIQIKNSATGKCITDGLLGIGISQQTCVTNVNDNTHQFWTIY